MTAAIGFKEWQIVCNALGSGRQSMILRKGGIHEGRAGFSFEHQSFYLFPTRFHAQAAQVREGDVSETPEWQPGEEVAITHRAEVVRMANITEWSRVAALEPLHIYSEQTIRNRFDWNGGGMATGSIHVALVRVSELSHAWKFPHLASYGGCRSWVKLPDPPAKSLESARPVIEEEDFQRLAAKLA